MPKCLVVISIEDCVCVVVFNFVPNFSRYPSPDEVVTFSTFDFGLLYEYVDVLCAYVFYFYPLFPDSKPSTIPPFL